MTERKPETRAGLALLVLALLGVASSGCLGERIDPATDPGAAYPPGHDEHHATPTPPAADLGPPDVVLEAHAGTPGSDLRFHPATLEAPLGSVVELRVENQGASPHTLTIHALGADTGPLAPGESRTLTFRADRAGSFEVMCDTPGHYEAGMLATLEVAAA